MSEIEGLRAEIAALREEQGFLLTSILAAVQQGVRVAAAQRDNTYQADKDRPFTVDAPVGASPAMRFAEALNRQHSARLWSSRGVPISMMRPSPTWGDAEELLCSLGQKLGVVVGAAKDAPQFGASGLNNAVEADVPGNENVNLAERAGGAGEG